MKMQRTVMAYSVHPAGTDPYFHEQVTRVEYHDEGAGPFVEISQPHKVKAQVQLAADELRAVYAAALALMGEGGEHEALLAAVEAAPAITLSRALDDAVGRHCGFRFPQCVVGQRVRLLLAGES